MLEKQSKKLMVEKQELLDGMAKLQSEKTMINEERLTAEAKRAKVELAMEESLKIPMELKEANHALELHLKTKEEEAVKLLDRACHAEVFEPMGNLHVGLSSIWAMETPI